MAETTMSVKLLAHTQVTDGDLRDAMIREYMDTIDGLEFPQWEPMCTDGQAVSLTAIRTCYSPLKPSEIVATEGEKYFGQSATDSGSGTDADRLMRQVVNSGHLSTLEHLTFTFAIEGVSRSLLAQLTRHRVGFSFSVQSQRYVRFGSGDKSGGFQYVVPDGVKKAQERLCLGFCLCERECEHVDGGDTTAQDFFEQVMRDLQQAYDTLRSLGVPPEDARAVLPNAAATNLTMTVNLRALLDFYSKRRQGRGAQAEIAQLAEKMRAEVISVEPWTAPFFEEA